MNDEFAKVPNPNLPRSPLEQTVTPDQLATKMAPAQASPRPLPEWRGRQTVRAAKIHLVQKDGEEILLWVDVPGPDGTVVKRSLRVRAGWVSDVEGADGAGEHRLVGGYYVEFQDGDTGWMPGDAFETTHCELSPEVPQPKPLDNDEALVDTLLARVLNEQKNPHLRCLDNDQLVGILQATKQRIYARNARRAAKS